MRDLTEKEADVLFDLWCERFDYNEETADTYNQLKKEGLTSREVLNELFSSKKRN